MSREVSYAGKSLNSHTRPPTAHEGHPSNDAVSQSRPPRERFRRRPTYVTVPQVNRHQSRLPAEAEANALESTGLHPVPIERGLCSQPRYPQRPSSPLVRGCNLSLDHLFRSPDAIRGWRYPCEVFSTGISIAPKCIAGWHSHEMQLSDGAMSGWRVK